MNKRYSTWHVIGTPIFSNAYQWVLPNPPYTGSDGQNLFQIWNDRHMLKPI